MMPTIKKFNTIAEIERAAWNACFPGALEDYDYLLAVEKSNIAGFGCAYYAVMDADKILCAVPAFFTAYDLATTAQGWVRSILMRIHGLWPRLLSLRLACLGSTATESCPLGLHPDLPETEKTTLLGTLLDFFMHDAWKNNCTVIGAKDINAVDYAHYSAQFKTRDFNFIASLPTARLPIDFKNIEEYLARLSRPTRKDMRRKLKSRDQVRVEVRENVDDLWDNIFAMYLETKNRGDWQFEELTRDYFQHVLAHMGKRALYVIYYVDEKPVAANLILRNQNYLLDKFFCMHGDIGRTHNLYFIIWFVNLQLCLDSKIPIYQSGQAAYETKIRLKSQLSPNWIYFRHRNPLIHWLLVMISPLLAFQLPKTDQTDV